MSAPFWDPRTLGRRHQIFVLLLLDDVGRERVVRFTQIIFYQLHFGFLGSSFRKSRQHRGGITCLLVDFCVPDCRARRCRAARPARGSLGGGTQPRSYQVRRDGREGARCSQRKAAALSSLAPTPRPSAFCSRPRSRLLSRPILLTEMLITNTFL